MPCHPHAALLLAASSGVLAPIARADHAADALSRDEVRALVAQLLADSETRSSLAASGAAAGYDKKFYFASGDGAFRLNVSGLAQVRYTLNVRDDDHRRTAAGFPTAGDDFNPGFSLRRAQIRFDGHVLDPALQYVVRLNYETAIVRSQTVSPIDPADPAAGVTLGTARAADARLRFDDVFFRYNLRDGWYVKWGQFKLPFLKEELNTEALSMAAERGMVNTYFTQDRSQGVSLGYESDRWWLEGAISDGLRTKNTPLGETFNRTSDIALTGRVEYIFAGSREQLRDYTSKPDEALAAHFGAAIHWQHQNNDPSVTNPDRATGTPANRSVLGVTLDGQVEGGGLSLFVAGVLGHQRARNIVQPAGGTQSDSLTDWGVTVQGAWRFAEKCEVFVRYDGLFLDEDRGLFDRDQFNFITFGFNHYFAGHAAKLTLDCVLSTNHTLGLTPSPQSAWLGNTNVINASSADASGLLGTARGLEAAVRLQMQVMF